MNSQDDKLTFKGEHVIQEIQAGRHEALSVMYPRYQLAFLRWARSWNQSFDDDTLIEAYMEAIMVFYTNVVTGHLIVLTTDVENYLITIGKNYLMKKYDKSKKTVYTDDFALITLPVQEDILSEMIVREMDEEKETKLKIAFAQLGNKCQQLLKLSFYEKLKAPQIREIMNYKDDTIAHVAKARCLAQLRALILKKDE